MDVADFNRVLSHTIAILNAGPYGTTLSTRNKTRDLNEIKAAIFEAGLIITQTLASYPSEYRKPFFVTTNINNETLVPDHLGKVVDVSIQRFTDDAFIQAKQKSYEQVQAYRINANQIYSKINHDQEGSPLGGYYDIWNDQLFFTGNAARITVAISTRTDVYDNTTSKIPVFFEPTWVKLTIGHVLKNGEGATVLAIADRYYNQGLADLNEFKSGKRVFIEVDEPEVMEAHQ
jgi:hypothetical protein